MTRPPSETPGSRLADGFPAPKLEQWRALVDKALKGADFEKRLVKRTADGLKIEPLYTRSDALSSALDAVPGAAPFTRGAKPVRAGWDIRTFHIESDPKVANAAILEDLEGGVTSIALQVGYGLAPTKEALGTALDGVLLDVCPIILVSGDRFFDAAAALNAVWDARGITPADRRGSLGADPLGTLAMSGRLSEPLDTALARSVALMKTTEASPGVQVMTADGVIAHNAGASEAQELAVTLSTLVAYLRAAEHGGVLPAQALKKINVSLAADIDEFSTIAKLRAARRLIWRVADASGAGDAAAAVTINCPTSYRIMAKRDPWTNILRTTIACTGAALGGADAIVVLPFTFALGKPDAFSRRVARNIQIVCQEESHLGRVTDPAGGSWYVENLTDDMAKKAWEVFQDIEARGGMFAALNSGYIQEMIAKTAQARAKDIATLRQELTGVSAFPLLGDDGVHAESWPAPVATSTKAVVEVVPLKPHRLGEAFEALRDEADAHGGFKVFAASMGEIADHNVRTTWVKNYLAAGGITALVSDGYKTPEAAAEAFKRSGAAAACICSSDAVNASLAQPTAEALKAAGAKLVLMAGRAGEQEAALKAAGVDQFLFAGADAVATLRGLQERLR
ncbi:methylmalonyl-CoA mutase family protein [Hyphomicrobium sp.]|jgi:methylmalonyl-CoA mutase|uniref:methylmalonyl-CoA mutase family protein n=1 Tax=Hyphomicrobium sp. TaxID=82 RepID=UPI002C618B65|nr:methylmalonyl-CoA mutase family protein [Hyphomicrobium sp.]HVZ03487.1 methylmalonyl-CoA mutase family protein [Hyphomicrobium sp.]